MNTFDFITTILVIAATLMMCGLLYHFLSFRELWKEAKSLITWKSKERKRAELLAHYYKARFITLNTLPQEPEPFSPEWTAEWDDYEDALVK